MSNGLELEYRAYAAVLSAPDQAVNGSGEPEGQSGAEGRRITGRIVPYGESSRRPISSGHFERFAPGVFAHTAPDEIPLRDEHGRVIGHMSSLSERADGVYGEFVVSRIPLGDEVLELIRSGAYRGLSVGFAPDSDPAHNRISTVEGKPTVTRSRADLVEVSVTGSPFYRGAQITAVRALGAREGQSMDEQTATVNGSGEIPDLVIPPAPAVPAPVPAPLLERMDSLDGRLSGALDAIRRVEAGISAPPAIPRAPGVELREWVGLQLRAGALHDRSAREELERRALEHILSSEVLGIIPPAYSSEVLDRAAPARPFWTSTRSLPAPAAGITAQLPRITARPDAGLQSAEKTELPTGNVTITSEPVNMQTVGWAGNVSLQAVERSDPPFLSILTDEMSAAYGLETEIQAITKLGAAVTTAGGVLGPTAADVVAQLAEAVGTAYTASSRRVWADTVWANLAGWSFLAGMTDLSGRPLFLSSSGQSGSISVTNAGGSVLGLRLELVPDLPATAQVVVGPSQGFVTMEDGPRQLSVSEPSVLGVEVAIYGYIWTHVLWPLAFTEFTVPTGVMASAQSSSKAKS